MDPQISEQQEVVTRSTTATPDQGRSTTRVAYRRAELGPAGFRSQQTIWLILGLVDLVLAIDFVFKILAANSVGFVSFIAQVAGAISAPFSGVFRTATSNGHLIYWPDVIALVVWTFAGWFVVRMIAIAAAPRMRNNTAA